jgi:hypothetical protein
MGRGPARVRRGWWEFPPTGSYRSPSPRRKHRVTGPVLAPRRVRSRRDGFPLQKRALPPSPQPPDAEPRREPPSPRPRVHRRRVGPGHERRDLRRARPGDRRGPRHRPRHGRRRHTPRHRRGAPRLASPTRSHGEATLRTSAGVARTDPRPPRGAGPPDDPGVGQGRRREPRRGGVRGRLCRVVRRGGAARIRRRDPAAHPRPAAGRGTAVGRRGCRHHPLELSAGDDHPQGGPRPRRRVSGGRQAAGRNAADGAGAVRARAPRRASARSAERGDHHRRGRSRAGAVRQPEGPQALLHRIHRRGQAADGTVCVRP